VCIRAECCRCVVSILFTASLFIRPLAAAAASTVSAKLASPLTGTSSESPSLSGPSTASRPSSATLRKMIRLVWSPRTLKPWMAGAGSSFLGVSGGTSSATGCDDSSLVRSFSLRFLTILENLGTSTPLTSTLFLMGTVTGFGTGMTRIEPEGALVWEKKDLCRGRLGAGLSVVVAASVVVVDVVVVVVVVVVVEVV